MEDMEQDFKKMLLNRIETDRKQREQVLFKYRIGYLIVEIFFGLLGAVILVNTLGWLATGGICILMMSYGLTTVRNIHTSDNNFFKNVWKSKK